MPRINLRGPDGNAFAVMAQRAGMVSSDHPGNFDYEQMLKLIVFDTLTEVIRVVESPDQAEANVGEL